MADKLHIKELAATIKRLHGADATHVETVPVSESFEGKNVWQGDVEVFELKDHPKAKRAFAWMHGLDDTKAKRHITVLGVHPIDSPEAAVRAVIIYDYKKQKK